MTETENTGAIKVVPSTSETVELAIILPTTGEMIDASDAVAVAVALRDLKLMEGDLRDARRALCDALIDHQARVGLGGTFWLDERLKVEIRSGASTVYDAEEIMVGLREAGMPEERITEIVKEVVTYQVAAVEAKRAAKANPAYAAVIAAHSHVVQRSPSVSVD